ncbi:MAG: serine/threonine-protein phosphatase [Desulfovibrio sp.]|uniref:PP2C family protein-serine/threonine phosphatase n=1 Tax=Desulfovibrio sp. TaxID=885 RepID=UPI00135D5637|nr:protein phosphatase 2C domain-containing protein [Desulfovibrio sp.]MTJ92616.1 serine/threonine-protein phosphatase [Desulfovibrio sp.]
MSMQIASASHTGNLRKRNEDRLFVSSLTDGELLLAVADGMGGAPQGEKAASIAVECLHEMQNLAAPPQQKLKALMLKAHNAILRYGRSHSGNDGMGTTMTLCLVHKGVVNWAHVGDSRLYRYHKNKLYLLTTDHRFVESMVRDGDMTIAEAKRHPFRNILDQSLGCPEIDPDYGAAALDQGDILLLCTDGLYDEVPFSTIEKILLEESDLQEKINKLLYSALNCGGKDNITIIVASYT